MHFFVATGNVCPLAIPESCAQNMGLRLLENHSLLNNMCRYQKIRKNVFSLVWNFDQENFSSSHFVILGKNLHFPPSSRPSN